MKDKSTVEYKPSVDNNDEDDLCDSCKTHIGFQYFVLEPENSKQLLTPDASPQEIETKPNKNEEAKKVANSQASHDLASLNERKAMVDEFNSLIEKPKRR